MDSAKHTAGPWIFLVEVGRVEGGVTKESPVCYVAAGIRTYGSHDLAEARANGMLIAAAPDLLQALEALLDHQPLTAFHQKVRKTLVDNAEAAIRKAKGE